jgi:ABC-2 type transport system permease protein
MRWWFSVSSLEIRKILAYRSDFWVTFVGQTLIQLFIARSLWQNIFESQKISEMRGFNLDSLTFFYLLVPVGTRILTGENIGFLAREIYDGSFTRYLIYPLSFFQYKSVTYLTHSLFYVLQLVLIYTIYRFFFSSNELFLSHLFFGLIILVFGAIVYLLMSLSTELFALWADNTWSLMLSLRFFTTFLGGGFIPLTFFPDWSRPIIKLLPFPYLLDLPIRTIMGQTHIEEIQTGIIILVTWICFFLFLMRFIWSRGQKTYSGVGI